MNPRISPEELCELVEEHFSTLLLFARRWSPQSAEDLVQDAFLQLIRRCSREGRPDQPVAWLFQVVRNAAIDLFRKNQTRAKHEKIRSEESPVHFVLPEHASVQAEEIEKMLRSLAPEQHEIVVARIWGGLTFEEIAAMLRLPRTTVFRTYCEALELMRNRL